MFKSLCNLTVCDINKPYHRNRELACRIIFWEAEMNRLLTIDANMMTKYVNVLRQVKLT